MTDDGWRSLAAEAAAFLDLPPGALTVDGTPHGLPSRLPAAAISAGSRGRRRGSTPGM